MCNHDRNGGHLPTLSLRILELAMYADANDGKPWTQQDLEDLRACIDSGLTVSQTAAALSREGSIEDVLETADKNGWKFHALNGYNSLD